MKRQGKIHWTLLIVSITLLITVTVDSCYNMTHDSANPRSEISEEYVRRKGNESGDSDI